MLIIDLFNREQVNNKPIYSLYKKNHNLYQEIM